MEKRVQGRHRRRPFLILCALFLVLFYVTPLYEFVGSGIQTQWEIVSNKLDASVKFCQHFPCFQQFWGKSTPYLVDTRVCKILDMDPMDSSVTSFLKTTSKMRCKKALVSLKDDTLVMNKDVARNWKYEGANCCYRTVTRVTQSPTNYDKNADWGISTSDKCIHISRSKGTKIGVPFFKIECQNSKKLDAGIQFDSMVLPPSQHSKTTIPKGKKWDNVRANPNSMLPINVLIVGIDSVSRLHMIRQLPETKKYLEANDFIEMKGYTKVGENTFPNIMAGIGGMENYKYDCWGGAKFKLDNCPLIWKNFSSAGYITALLEDAPGIAIFNYEKTGFVMQPTDHYLRTLMTAAHLHAKKGKSSAASACLGDGINPTEYMINYMRRFVGVHGNKYPYFLLSWFTSLAHDDFNGLQTQDAEFRDLLKEVVEKESYGGNNTLILFISDHGYRFGKFRETFLGFYEESLPFFFIRMPPVLKKRFPKWYDNLKDNSHRLTSPLDLYETLKDILDVGTGNETNSSRSIVQIKIPGENSSETWLDLSRNATFRRHYSFFESAPLNRSCESSGIPQLFCRCGVTPAVDKGSAKSKQLAQFAVTYINSHHLKSVINQSECHTLRFSKVLYSRELLPGEAWNNFGKLVKFQDYILAFEAKPGDGHFEGRIRVFQNGTQSILNSVSRINSYAGQSDCIEDYTLRNYCMCKKLVKGL